MPRYKHLVVRKVELTELAAKTKIRSLSPRQLAQLQRDKEIRLALDEAASLPATQAVVIELRDDQKMPTLRTAVDRTLKAEPRDLNWGVRGRAILISKGPIPGGRRRK